MLEANAGDGAPPTGEGAAARSRAGTLPHILVLGMTLAGVAYTSMTRQPVGYYWEAVAVVIGVICVVYGWPSAPDWRARWILLRTQVLHWGAFLVAMSLVFAPSVQAVVNADSTSLVILLLLALGTFVAGAHLPSWRMCLNGTIMALCVPAIAWLDQSALLVTLVFLLAAAAAGWFVWLQWRGAPPPRSPG